ncbi:hypothetical protein ACIBL3_46605 [Kribbella sp. NPDC050124]|uniref:hypothetical protein n=1 Tax=Kribbella sp. NPDC050124 TaxID=3364114 RepID=UPI00379CA417
MEIVRLGLLLLHLLGFSVLLGGLISQARQQNKQVTGLVRGGAGLAVVTGLALVGVIEANGGAVDTAKIGVKLGISVVILALAVRTSRRDKISTGLWIILLALSIGDVSVALFWSPAHGSY